MIRKITMWYNSTPVCERWDVELVHDDGERERKINIKTSTAKDIIEQLMKIE